MWLHGVVFADLETFGDRGHSPWSIGFNNLKVGASDTMDSMGAVILHEWLHWDNHFVPIASPIRDWNCNGPMVVIPPNGNGPYNANVLKLSRRVPTANAENYVWLRVEIFLQNKLFRQDICKSAVGGQWKLQSHGIPQSHKHWWGNCAVDNSESEG